MRRLLGKLLGGGPARVTPDSLTDEGEMPAFRGISDWINTDPLTRNDLDGKVVLVDFWTLSCVNCTRTLPHLKSWHDTYKNSGLRIVGIHTPEFAFERDAVNVRATMERHGIEYAVALDNDHAMWKAYRNHYWPAHYFVDRKGRIRYHHFGEGGYGHSESVLRTLLSEDGTELPAVIESEEGADVDLSRVGTPETYLGYERLEYLGSPEPVKMDEVSRYSTVMKPAGNVFYLEGDWEISREWAAPRSENASLLFKVRASRVNLVMDTNQRMKRVQVELDGGPLRDREAGVDTTNVDKMSIAEINEGRMYELVDTRGKYSERELRLTFIDPGTKLYAFTFG
ncbi:MAG: redoxin domain-containing protein [Patescibacteria group bacterium]|nr:redoxin domain-containing protein [Patescibacteria group bacterium]